MGSIIEYLTGWIRETLISGIESNLSGCFQGLNDQVAEAVNNVGQTPVGYMPGVYALIRNLSETVILPIAGIILTFVACYELIQLIIGHNNLANFETWIFWKWIFKTFIAVTLIANTFNITMAIFDVAQWVVSRSGGVISGSTQIDASALEALFDSLESMDLGALMMILMQSFIIKIGIMIIGIVIYVIVNGRMLEIYLMTSLAPIPFATLGSHEQSMIGQNYLRSLIALGLQGFLIMVCMGIYSVLLTSVVFSADIIGSLWSVLGFTVLLAFTLFKTGAIAKSILNAH